MNIVKAKLIQLAEEEQRQEENKEYTFDELNKLCQDKYGEDLQQIDTPEQEQEIFGEEKEGHTGYPYFVCGDKVYNNLDDVKSDVVEEQKTTQEFNSAGTSLNQIPALHKKLVNKNMLNGVNFDNGAGKFDKATNFLADNDIQNVRYDPYNLPEEVNKQADNYVGQCDTSTCANVLNVIKEDSAKIDVLKRSYDMLKPGGTLYISVYEGNRSGIGKESKPGCWQENKKLKDYVPIVEKVFPKVTISNGMIEATKE